MLPGCSQADSETLEWAVNVHTEQSRSNVNCKNCGVK